MKFNTWQNKKGYTLGAELEDIQNLKDLAYKKVLAIRQLNVYEKTKDFKEVEKLGVL